MLRVLSRSLGALLTAGILLTAVAATAADAQQTGTIRGQITGDAGAPVEGVQVVVVGTTRGAVTDASGRYEIRNVPVGTHTLRVENLGYRIVEAQVRVNANQTTTHDVALMAQAVALEAVRVTVGSRAAHTAADELAVPVDVFPQAEIAGTARVELAEVLQELTPSVYFPRQQISDITSGVRPYQMRGLSPDHSLVLINGKRRHPTAVVHVFGGAALTSGSSGVDMNAIPTLAIGQMEVLRDGAAAQYGSDAIAGVINLQLKNTTSEPAISMLFGKYYPDEYSSDGQRLDIAGNWGVPIFGRGTLNLTAQVSDRDPTHRACPDPRDQLAPGDADVIDGCRVVQKNNPVQQPNHLWGDGEFRNYIVFWNAEVPLAADAEDRQAYLFGGVSRRADLHSGYFRRSLDARNWPSIHPHGFLPTFDSRTRDIMAVAGVRGRLGEWHYDAGAQFGQNRVDNDIVNTLNASLGPCLDQPCAPGPDGILGTADDPGIPNKTSFYAGTLELNQLVTDLDFVREVDLGLASPLNVALGASLRAENYVVVPGEPGSYVNGYHPAQNGSTAAVGAQVFTGYRPEQRADEWRTNAGLYVDLETRLTGSLLAAVATRFENYSDFGSTMTGKVALRLQPHERFVLRAAASTGFRAPALSQSYYGHTSTGFRRVEATGDQEAYEIGEFPVNSPEARALGAVPLQEERSRNLSAGFAITPFDRFNITGDAYFVKVDDRIILTNSLTGDRIEELLAAYQAKAVKYFTNAVNTETWGYDITATYTHLLRYDRLIELSAAYNHNVSEIVGDIVTPPLLEGYGAQFFPQDARIALERGRPRDRLNAKVRYTHGPLRAQLGGNYYGEITSLLNEDPWVLHTYPQRAVWDAEIGYRLPRGLELSIGAENVFDTYPEAVPEDYNFLGIFRYPGSSAFGYNGRFLYTRLRANL